MTRVENPMVTGEWPYDTPHKGEGPRTHHPTAPERRRAWQTKPLTCVWQS